MSLKKDHTLKIYINNVEISDVANDYPWTVTVDETAIVDDPTTADIDESKLYTLYVEETEKDGVVFEIDGGSEVTYKAASKQPITFTFTAETTPIRERRGQLCNSA